ncbi:MAG: hypothetical protein JEZ03_14505, partial [Bacteroidales bacterium]|nr:hypothetical protein [Bacteroidales bacterium]
VFDEENKVGHDYANVLPKVNVEIPFLLWLSPFVKTTEPGWVDGIYFNTNKPYVTDDLFHSILDLNFIKTAHFQASKSIFSRSYDSSRKRILEDGQDFDQK